MAAYADYSRNSYSNSIFALERFINNYPADENIPYAHYLIAICYYEQILDEKKDLEQILKRFIAPWGVLHLLGGLGWMQVLPTRLSGPFIRLAHLTGSILSIKSAEMRASTGTPRDPWY